MLLCVDLCMRQLCKLFCVLTNYKSFPLKLSVILVIAIFLSSRVNPCEIKVVFSSETRGGGTTLNAQTWWKLLLFIVRVFPQMGAA